MSRWTFWQYAPTWGKWPFRDWYNRETAVAQNACDFSFRTLRDSEDWLKDKDMFRDLKGPHVPLSEICFRADVLAARDGRTIQKRKIRIFGFRDVDAKRFHIYGAGEEARIGHYIPPGADDDALRFYQINLDGRGDLHEIDLD